MNEPPIPKSGGRDPQPPGLTPMHHSQSKSVYAFCLRILHKCIAWNSSCPNHCMTLSSRMVEILVIALKRDFLFSVIFKSLQTSAANSFPLYEFFQLTLHCLTI